MTHLTPAQRAELEQRLRGHALALRDELDREVDRDAERQRLTEEARDSGDHAVASALFDLDRAEVGRDVAELGAIDRSLRALRSDDYGWCCDCGDPIPFARLRAQPTAQRCSRCQSVYERTHAGAGRLM